MFRLLWASLKSDYLRLSTLLVVLFLGLLGLNSTLILSQVVESEVNTNSKSLLAGDLTVEARRKIPEEVVSQIDNSINSKNFGEQLKRFRRVNTLSMVSAQSGAPILAQIVGVSEGFPFYGKMKLDPHLDLLRPKQGTVWIYPDLALRLGLVAGNLIEVAGSQLVIAAVIEKDLSIPVGVAAVSSRLYVAIEDLEQLGLLQMGATFSDQYVYKIPTDYPKLAQISMELGDLLDDPAYRILTYREFGQETARVFSYLRDFLSIVSLIGILLASIAAIYLFASYLQSSTSEIAVQHVLGLSWSRTRILFVLKGLSIGFIASTFAYVCSYLILPVVAKFLSEFLPVKPVFSFSIEYFLVSVICGSSLAALISYLVLSTTKNLDVRQLFSEQPKLSLNFRFIGIPGLVFIAALVLLSWVVLKSLIVLTYFWIGILLAIVLSSLLFAVFMAFRFTQVKAASSFSLHHFSWSSMRHQSGGVFISSSVLFLVLLLGFMVPSLRVSLVNQLKISPRVPQIFLFDIQNAQMTGLEDLLRSNGMSVDTKAPFVRGKFISINGRSILKEKDSLDLGREEREMLRAINRGINLSFANELPLGQRIVQGTWFSSGRSLVSDTLELSVESNYAERLGLELGSQILIEIDGQQIQSKITSLRQVSWNDFQPAFFVLAKTDSLSNLNYTWVATVSGLAAPQLISLQKQIFDSFGNVSVVDVQRTVKSLEQTLGQVTKAIYLLSAVIMILGFYVFAAIGLRQIQQKLADYRLLSLLGASKRLLIQLSMKEFVWPSIVIGLSALVSSQLIVKILLYYVFQVVDFEVDPSTIGIAVATLSILVTTNIILLNYQLRKGKAIGQLQI